MGAFKELSIVDATLKNGKNNSVIYGLTYIFILKKRSELILLLALLNLW